MGVRIESAEDAILFAIARFGKEAVAHEINLMLKHLPLVRGAIVTIVGQEALSDFPYLENKLGWIEDVLDSKITPFVVRFCNGEQWAFEENELARVLTWA